MPNLDETFFLTAHSIDPPSRRTCFLCASRSSDDSDDSDDARYVGSPRERGAAGNRGPEHQ